jgi:hypothetical protein
VELFNLSNFSDFCCLPGQSFWHKTLWLSFDDWHLFVLAREDVLQKSEDDSRESP